MMAAVAGAVAGAAVVYPVPRLGHVIGMDEVEDALADQLFGVIPVLADRLAHEDDSAIRVEAVYQIRQGRHNGLEHLLDRPQARGLPDLGLQLPEVPAHLCRAGSELTG